MTIKEKNKDDDNLLARLIDDLLQEVRELLDDGDWLARGQADAVHWGRCVVG